MRFLMFMRAEHKLQQNRAEDGRNYYKHNRRNKRIDSVTVFDKRMSRCVNSQRNLTSGNHSESDRCRITGVVFTKSCNRTAADNFSDYSDGDKYKAEKQIRRLECTEICADSDICEENRGENHIAVCENLFVNEVGVLKSAEHDSGKKCTGDCGDSEKCFGGISIKEAHGESKNTCSSCVGITLANPNKRIFYREAETNANDEETDGFKQRHSNASAAVEACYQAQCENSEHIVDDCGAENCCADLGFQLAHFV